MRRESRPSGLLFWLTLARGVLALTLGVLVLVWPERSAHTLGNFMGLFWLMNGIVALRWGLNGERPSALSFAVGALGTVAGMGILLRGLFFGTPSIGWAVFLLGAIVALTGTLHLFVGVQRGGEREASRVARLIGSFEFLLGLGLMISGADIGVGLYIAAGVWAVLAGLFLIGDARRIRRITRAVATVEVR